MNDTYFYGFLLLTFTIATLGENYSHVKIYLPRSLTFFLFLTGI